MKMKILFHCSNSKARNLFWSISSQDLQHITLRYESEEEILETEIV